MKFDFDEWLENNNHIWEAFEKQALLVSKRGFKHYSARTIVEFLRHHTAISEEGSLWKINDHAIPHLSRLFMKVHPEHKGLFETRGMT